MINLDDFSKIINWDSVFSKSHEFQNNSPTKYTFVRNFFFDEFYENLYNTFPKLETFKKVEEPDKSAYRRWWGTKGQNGIIDPDENDDELSSEWNLFYRYLHSKNFMENFRKFSNVNVNKTKHFAFLNMQKGGYQLPHIHDVGPSTLILLLYFNRDWPDGSPGGTYISKNNGDEIIFEPYDLNNSCMIFQDGPYAEHGVRYLDRDTERRALQITIEGYTDEHGWSSVDRKIEKIEL